jgi:hypothetical protein
MLRFIVGHGGFHFLKNFSLIPLVFHIDEIDNDQSAQIPQPHLPADFGGGFNIRL